MIRTLIALAFLLFALPAVAQDAAEDENSFFVSFVENQLSGPNRQIRISNIQGALSSNATIGLISVADNEGVWLRIVNASIVWSRTALLFSQRLQIDELTAERIEFLRQPIPDDSLPSPEATVFQVPELPIGVNLDRLAVPLVRFGPEVFGLESEISVEGRIALAGGSLDSELAIVRLDGPGGTLRLAAAYENATEILALDLALAEPENGIVANLLNLDGRPPVDLTLTGEGPLSELNVALTLDAAGERILAGGLALRQQAGGLGFSADLRGPIAQLIPARFRGFFGAETALDARGLVKDEGGFRLDSLSLATAALNVAASAETGPDGFLTALSLDAVIDDGDDAPVVLPVPGGTTTVEQARLIATYGDGARWSGRLTIGGLSTPDFTAAETVVSLGGLARDIGDPERRGLSFAVEGLLSGIAAARPEVAEALGDEIRLDIAGDWQAGQPVRLERAELRANALTVALSGTVAEFAFTGDMGVRTDTIAPFSALAERPLSGSLELAASGVVRPISGAFDLTIDSAGRELRIGTEAVDNLLGGLTTITGRVARDENGLHAEGLRIGNEQIELTAEGTFATGAADFAYELVLADLGLVSPRASGRVEASGRARGAEGLINLTSTLAIPNARLGDRRLTEARAVFEGLLEDGTLDGTLGASAFLDGVRVELATALALAEGERRLEGLDFVAGGARGFGSIVQNAEGLFEGELAINAADISVAAGLAMVEASGAVRAQLSLSHAEGRQNASVEAELRNVRVSEVALAEARIEAAIADLFSVPAIDGSITARGIRAGGIDVATLSAVASHADETTAFRADATLDNGTQARARGTLRAEGDGYRVGLDEASVGQGPVAARLIEPASLLVVGDEIEITALAVDVAGGRVTARGRAGATLDLSVDIARLPLSIANLVRPDLGLGGTLDGNAVVTGPRESPDLRFRLQGRQVTAEALRQAGQTSLDIDASGATAAGRVTLEAAVTSPEGLRATVRGSAPLGDGQLALDIVLEAFPLAALNRVAPGQDLGGTLSGTARVGGTVAAPQATFDLRAAGLRAAPLQAAGIAAMDAAAAGRFSGETVTLTSATVSGPQGLSLSASGTIPVSGAGLSLAISGDAPLSLANRFLIDRGTQVSGTIQLNGTVTGSLQQPQLRGMFSTTGAQVIDPEANIRLNAINVLGAIDGETVTLRSATASIANGGTVSAGGTISIDAAAGFPANLQVTLASVRYTDGDLVVATASGTLAVSGALLRDPLLSGRIDVERAEITVPENLAGGATSIDVVHRNPPRAVQDTLRRARASDGTPVPSARPSVLRLDVTVSAPARIFVRGRGLDAELGGSVRLTGPVTSIQPVGAFELIRGRLSILGQRITFDEGRVTLIGDLDPFLNFIARSQGGDITVFITVSGRVSDLDISFSSQPQLPEDEVLARLIFNRGIGELSALQIAQLAAAAAELAGGANTSLLGSLRAATGLDDLDIVTDSEGNAAVRAGRYIQENVYLGVEAGAQGTTRATINLDITDDLKARGSVGTDGESSLGIFFERDY